MLLNVLDHGGFAIIRKGVVCKRNQHKDRVDHGDPVDDSRRHTGKQNQKNQADEQDGRADLAG